jgi:hypothetical protein
VVFAIIAGFAYDFQKKEEPVLINMNDFGGR